MPRIARVVVPFLPHHCTQRGNRRQKTFFTAPDYQTYFDLLVEAKHRARVEIWAYCLMPNHVHFVVVPYHPDGLAGLFQEAHKQYTRHINFRAGWRGHLWQERFHSFVMDERHLMSAARYIELNPVRAGLCMHPQDWQWSSTVAHLEGIGNGLVDVEPMLSRVADWRTYLSNHEPLIDLERIRLLSRTGRPGGDEDFVAKLEKSLDRRLHLKKPGPKPNAS